LAKTENVIMMFVGEDFARRPPGEPDNENWRAVRTT
jgi:hypothetical protein